MHTLVKQRLPVDHMDIEVDQFPGSEFSRLPDHRFEPFVDLLPFFDLLIDRGGKLGGFRDHHHVQGHTVMCAPGQGQRRAP
jgi:hypothetical protein